MNAVYEKEPPSGGFFDFAVPAGFRRSKGAGHSSPYIVRYTEALERAKLLTPKDVAPIRIGFGRFLKGSSGESFDAASITTVVANTIACWVIRRGT